MHFDHSDDVRFITFSCHKQMPLLKDDLVKGIFIKYLMMMREIHHVEIYGYVVMPDHVHLVIHPPDNIKLRIIIQQLKSFTAREYFKKRHGPVKAGEKRSLWKRRYYDHNCRSAKSVLEKIGYCHNNPVRRGLVNDPSDYLWSSHNWYLGEKMVPVEMDEIGL